MDLAHTLLAVTAMGFVGVFLMLSRGAGDAGRAGGWSGCWRWGAFL